MDADDRPRSKLGDGDGGPEEPIADLAVTSGGRTNGAVTCGTERIGGGNGDDGGTGAERKRLRSAEPKLALCDLWGPATAACGAGAAFRAKASGCVEADLVGGDSERARATGDPCASAEVGDASRSDRRSSAHGDAHKRCWCCCNCRPSSR